MPNRWTFQIAPITRLVSRYVGDGKGWIDPFAGISSPAEFTNDLNPDCPTTYHMDSLTFLNQLTGQYDGVLFDPPYSLRQAKECYESLGRDFTLEDSRNVGRWLGEKARLCQLIKPGGYALSFGWNSNGIGRINGFEVKEILLVCHGGAHNDTIVTVEQKLQGELSQWGSLVAWSSGKTEAGKTSNGGSTPPASSRRICLK